MLKKLEQRFKECELELHPTKTKIVYCKDENRADNYPIKTFDFLGYCFRPRRLKSKDNKLFVGFTPAVSKTAVKAMRAEIRRTGIRNRTDMSLREIADQLNPVLRGWLEYYGRFNTSSMYQVMMHFNQILVRWAMRKYDKFKCHKWRASEFIVQIAHRDPTLFEHYKRGMVPKFI